MLRLAARSALWSLVAVALASLISGCACNEPNSLEQSYCEAYSKNTVGPAIAGLIGFFILAIVIVWGFRRWYRPTRGPGSAPQPAADAALGAGLPWTVEGLQSRPPCDVLEELLAAHPKLGRLSEGYDGRWLAEVRLTDIDPPLDFVGVWTARDQACRDALDALVVRGIVKSDP